MNILTKKILAAAESMGIKNWREWMPDPIVIESGAIRQVAAYIHAQKYQKIILVADQNTYQAAGQWMEENCKSIGIDVTTTLIIPDRYGYVIADEASIIQVILDIQSYEPDLVVAVGSGTIHDIVRYAAYTVKLPFLSVPTAASVDGYTSKGAPLFIRGEKITLQAIGPVAIFADLDILCAAPASLAAAGFGDMLGKYTSLLDWNIGRLLGNEAYSVEVAEITRQALLACVEHIGPIAQGSKEGIQVLTLALIESGLAMLLFGQSHPASGAEHHLSHYWEMELHRLGRPPLLHGAKVGVSCAEMTELYRRAAEHDLSAHIPFWLMIQQEVLKLPEPEELRGMLRMVGGCTTIEELGVERELLDKGLREAYLLRKNRHTLLRAINEGQLLSDIL